MEKLKMPIVTACISCVFLNGCLPKPRLPVLPTMEEKILAAARQAVEKNDTWVASAEFEKPTRTARGGWSVTVWRLPKTPGGFRDIELDANGKVVRYDRGE